MLWFYNKTSSLCIDNKTRVVSFELDGIVHVVDGGMPSVTTDCDVNLVSAIEFSKFKRSKSV